MGRFVVSVRCRGMTKLVQLVLCGCLLLFSGCVDAPIPVPDEKPTAVELNSGSKGSDLLAGLTPNVKSEASHAKGYAIHFVERQQEAGLSFVFDNGAAANRKLMPEATSGGAGWIDYDADGLPDVYFAQGGASWETNWSQQPVDQLFRNLGEGKFSRVTEWARIPDAAYGHGVAVGDYNEDGFDDIYICNVGRDALLLNLGDGTFEDVTEAAGISNLLWGASAAWGDLDGDGDLDLYVANYVDYNPLDPILCTDSRGNPGTCHPKDVGPVPNRCFINQGDGTFREEADSRGLNGPGSKSLGVVIADFNGDGQPDVYVANDTTANHLFVNQGQGQFQESAVALGCAASGLGHYQASMGVAAGDYDRNGWLDLYITHFTSDSNTLYRNLGGTGFTDATRDGKLHFPTLPLLGFGTIMADLNADGWQDLFVANGHIDNWEQVTGDDWYMRPQLFRFNGRSWDECGPDAGPYFSRKFLGRGVATADYDQDGDLDLLVVHQNDSASLLENVSETGNWLQVRLIGWQSNRRGVGARVTVTQGDLILTQQLMGGTSYASAHEPILCFGLADRAEPCTIEVLWPSGLQQHLADVSVNQRYFLQEREASE